MHIEFTNIQTGQVENQEVMHCFHLATFPSDVGSCHEIRDSFNLGFQLPHKSTEESNAFWNKIHGPYEKDKPTPVAYFCNEGARIPFYVLDGNGYDEAYGTSCLFGYANVFLFASDERPKTIDGKGTFGAYIMGFYNGPDRNTSKSKL